MAYTRCYPDWLAIGQELTYLKWGTRKPKLPPSKLGAQRAIWSLAGIGVSLWVSANGSYLV